MWHDDQLAKNLTYRAILEDAEQLNETAAVTRMAAKLGMGWPTLYAQLRPDSNRTLSPAVIRDVAARLEDPDAGAALIQEAIGGDKFTVLPVLEVPGQSVDKLGQLARAIKECSDAICEIAAAIHHREISKEEGRRIRKEGLEAIRYLHMAIRATRVDR